MKREKIYIAILFIFSAFLRMWISKFNLLFLDYDPFYHARIGRIIYGTKRIPSFDYQELGGIKHYYPPLFHILIAFSKIFLPFFDFIEVASLLNVIFGALSVIMLYILSKEAFNKRVAVITSLIYATLPGVVLRQGLFARPLGISMFFAILSVYLFFVYQKTNNKKFLDLAFLVMIIFSLTHSSFIAVSIAILLASLMKREKYTFYIISGVLFFAFVYYFDFILHQYNFSTGYTMEYLPFLRIEKFEFIFQPFELWGYVGGVLYFSHFALSWFPLIIYGIYLSFKKDIFIGIITLLGFLSAFFKTNIFLLFSFTLAICMAVALERMMKLEIKKINYGWSFSVFLIIMILSTNLYLCNSYRNFNRMERHVEPVKKAITAINFTENDLILSNDINVGHEIAYYSKAGVFLSDLTDTKKWSRNAKIYNKLFNSSEKEAKKILKENKITYVLIIDAPNEKVFPWIKNKKAIYERDEIKIYEVSKL